MREQVGQALVIAVSVVLNDLLYLELDVGRLLGGTESRMVGVGLARGSSELTDRHLFSLYFMLPLVGVCLGLLKHNWYAHPHRIALASATSFERHRPLHHPLTYTLRPCQVPRARVRG